MERAEEHATRAKHATAMVPVEVSNYGDFRNKVYFFEYEAKLSHPYSYL